ncbi:nucleotidyl transferase AbiEii/AbiGii toxin family protein [Capnocytophaga gingivalis]|uniref:nucleotidyl transferase AbiEii/AbiGii toxin family protein n=1 Tax=Capnocytophaga gingivalis TaxID=1017 RepID=UPI0028E28041|nr:nucleotidyl transferase AbiEii/AbiGii toxin family protein [Capnocytophaga gingivalis]
MNYRILSKELSNPELKEILQALNSFFQSKKIDFYIVGATARDILLTNLYGLIPERKTMDIDIAIAISDWKEFEIIERELPQREYFEKNNQQKQRFMYKEFYAIDVIPFGGIAQKDGNIYWPPDGVIAMSVLGFPEIAAATISVNIDDEFAIKVSSLSGFFLLKMMAWKDRYLSSSKDAYDIALILLHYLGINEQRAVQEHYDLYEVEPFDQVEASGRLIARDVKALIGYNKDTMAYLRSIVAGEISLAQESPLVNQLVKASTRLKPAQVLRILTSMYKEWADFCD